jgi:hypothetical protein
VEFLLTLDDGRDLSIVFSDPDQVDRVLHCADAVGDFLRAMLMTITTVPQS